MDPFIYQYSIGGFIFLVGLGYAFRQGYVGFTGRPLRNLLILMAGLGVLMGLQGYLQYGSMTELPAQEYVGEPLKRGIIGEPIDYAIMIGYFVMILIVGTYFGRNQKSTKDFFFAGQRFSWWLISLSLVATTVGSYSFVKYSKVAYDYGLSSSQTYLNDWFWVPLFLFGWLPILYFSRITSIPEYFERRFGRTARAVATFLLLVYLIGYVGVNLFTMGKALNHLIGWDIRVAALVVAAISATYVTFGGQTSVIMTDLLQGGHAAGHGSRPALPGHRFSRRSRRLMGEPTAHTSACVRQFQLRSRLSERGHILAGRRGEHGHVLFLEPGHSHAFHGGKVRQRGAQSGALRARRPDAYRGDRRRLGRLGGSRPGQRRCPSRDGLR